jgi:hypothetical protein
MSVRTYDRRYLDELERDVGKHVIACNDVFLSSRMIQIKCFALPTL